MRGELTTDPASIAALGHAVHAAGNELAVRVGAPVAQSITLNGPHGCLTLLPVPQGILLLEHELHLPADLLQVMAGELMAQSAPPPPAVIPVAAPFSLADALHATAP